MTPIDRFERRLPAALTDLAAPSPPDYLIDILGRLTKCMSDYNGSVYADDPEYDFSDDDRAKIDAAETKAREYLPTRIDEASVAIKKFAEAVAADLRELRLKRRLYDQMVASANLPAEKLE